MSRKVAIVGVGNVGAAAAFALVMKVGSGVRDLVLVDINKKRAEAEAADILHATPFANPVRIRAGDYPDIAGARVVVLCCGVGQKPGETRLQLLQRNAKIFSSVVPSVLEHAPNAVLVCVANPVDVLTHIAAFFAVRAGVPASRVIGTGTMLDSARFRALLGSHLDVDSPHVHASVLGEHGDSEVLSWSTVQVASLPLEAFCRSMGKDISDEKRKQITDQVVHAAYSIIEGKGSTYFGIASSVTKLVSVLLHGERSVLTLCARVQDYSCIPELNGVTLSLPHIVTDEGAVQQIPVNLSSDERDALVKSAQTLREAIDSLKLEETFPKSDSKL